MTGRDKYNQQVRTWYFQSSSSTMKILLWSFYTLIHEDLQTSRPPMFNLLLGIRLLSLDYNSIFYSLKCDGDLLFDVKHV